MEAIVAACITGSRPSRARGLKREFRRTSYPLAVVAPLAGARVETRFPLRGTTARRVAPLAGARVETRKEVMFVLNGLWSRPSRARGLKLL